MLVADRLVDLEHDAIGMRDGGGEAQIGIADAAWLRDSSKGEEMAKAGLIGVDPVLFGWSMWAALAAW